MSFGILTCSFVQCPSYLLRCTLPFSTFIIFLISFDSSFHKVFGRFLGLRSFDSLKELFVCKQTSFPITFDGVKFILTSTIAFATYLKSWAFIISVIVVGFMVHQHPVLLKALTRVDNNTFPFQQHLKATCDLLSPPACVCFLPFKQAIEQQMVQLQDSILEHLHHHALSNMLFDKTSKAHRAQILSCYGPKASA